MLEKLYPRPPTFFCKNIILHSLRLTFVQEYESTAVSTLIG
jgi:hypothetical protein